MLRASDFGFTSLHQRFCPVPGGFLRPPVRREERSLQPGGIFFAGRVFVFLEGGSVAGGGYEIEIGKEILLQRAVCRPVFVGSGDGFRLRLLWV